MTAYNIVNPASLVSGQPEDVSQVLANLQAIQTILNGGIDNSNLSAGAAIAKSKLAALGIVDADISAAAAIALSKLAGYPSDGTKFPAGDGTWKTPPGGLTTIFDVVVGRGNVGDPASPAATIDSNTILSGNIPQTYSHLKLVIQGRMNDATTFDNLLLTLNNDTGANYDNQWLYAQAAPAGGTEQIAASFGFLGYIASGNSAAGSAGNYEVVFPNYARTDFHKQYLGTFGTTAQATTNLLAGTVTGKLRSTAALTRIKILGSTGSFVAGTRVTLYGVT